jgi:hypothetical protein
MTMMKNTRRGANKRKGNEHIQKHKKKKQL